MQKCAIISLAKIRSADCATNWYKCAFSNHGKCRATTGGHDPPGHFQHLNRATRGILKNTESDFRSRCSNIDGKCLRISARSRRWRSARRCRWRHRPAGPDGAETVRGCDQGCQGVPRLFHALPERRQGLIEIKPEQLEKPFFIRSTPTRHRRGLPVPLTGCCAATWSNSNAAPTMCNYCQERALQSCCGTPMAQAVKSSFTDSILGSATVASLPHPERKSILIEANGIFLTDLPGTSTTLEAVFRMPYCQMRAIPDLRACVPATT